MKKNAIFGLGAAIMLALFGCANSPIQSETEPLDPISSSSQAEEEAPMEKTVVATTTVKAEAREWDPVTMAYPGGSTTNMAATGNATTVRLDEELFDVDANKGDTNLFPGLNKDGSIKLYSKKSSRNGCFFTVSIAEGHSISSVSIDFGSNGSYATVSKGWGSDFVEVSGVGNVYEIDARAFKVQNTYYDLDNTKTIDINSIEITYEGAAKEVAAGLPTQLSLSYTYLKEGDGVIDTLDKAATGNPSSYTDWEDVVYPSGITYAGNNSGNYGTIQLRDGSNSGLVSTDNPFDREAKKIILKWDEHNSAGRQVEVYGSNDAYSSPADLYGAAKGDILGTLTKPNLEVTDETELTIASSYKFIGFKAKDGAAFLPSISIQWDDLPTFTYSDVAIRFGNLMKKTLWDRLNTESNIQGYGVMLSNLGTGNIQGTYDAALLDNSDDIDAAITDICEKGNIKDFYTSLASKPNPDLATDKQKGDLTGDYYIWNLYKGVSNENLLKSYDAIAYIRIEDEIVFLNEVTTSVKGLAGELLEMDAYDEESFGGSLNDLANLEEE